MSNITTRKRKPGAPPGKRPVVWVCSGLKDLQLITESYVVNDQDPGDGKPGLFPKEVAEFEFYDNHGIRSAITLGPFFNKCGSLYVVPKRKRLQVDRENLDQYKLEAKRRKAV